MNTRYLLCAGSLLALVGVAACGDSTPVAPLRPPTTTSVAASQSSVSWDENVAVSPALGRMNARLAAWGAKVRIAKAELRMSNQWTGKSATILLAKDRSMGIGAEWVPGDPRRGGRVGVTYAFGSNNPNLPYVSNADLTSIHQATTSELDAQIELGMAAWRDQTCSSAPITRVPAGPNPDFLDDLIAGTPENLVNYVQPSDIVHSSWQPVNFFTDIFGPDGNFVIGATFSFVFIDDNGTPADETDDFATDIDWNRKADLGLAEIYYNADMLYSTSGAFNLSLVDFFSTVGHESGHGVGLGHLGKVFIQPQDLADGLQPGDIKYAPYALMNAAYIAGHNDLGNADRTQFCWIWHD